MKASSKLNLLSRISAIEKALEEAIKSERTMANRLMKLERKSVYQKKWMNKDEFKEYTGITNDGTIYQMVQDRKFTTRRSGGLKFERKSVDAFLESRTKKSVGELEKQEA